LGLCSLVVAKFTESDNDAGFTTEPMAVTLPVQDASPDTPPLSQAPNEVAEPAPAVTHKTAEAKVKPGDNLALIFKRQGISAADLQRVLASAPLGPRLRRIYPGHNFTFTLSEDNSLIKLQYSPGPLETLEFERRGDSFSGREVTQEPERAVAYKHATLDHSLFVSSQRAGFDDSLTMRLAQIFQWDIDFVLDIRRGDEFHVLYEELYLSDEFIGYGNILAAEFVNQGESYQALLYTDDQGDSGYYAPNGANMRKAFLRAPVEFSRISSNFNLRRVHPLFKRTMPHRGIDYAAPRGTPILASGDGTVTIAGRTNANGNYVVIKHGEQFVTKYLHLSKFSRGARKGSRVKQGQTIGYVGATGWATAPHLHYEFLVNGVHKNPRTVNLPEANPIQADERQSFEFQAHPRLALLTNYKHQTQLAFRGDSSAE
jgi:murein DD-endopeptidase MepM/ murein hydrolase activator NlpD